MARKKEFGEGKTLNENFKLLLKMFKELADDPDFVRSVHRAYYAGVCVTYLRASEVRSQEEWDACLKKIGEEVDDQLDDWNFLDNDRN